VWLGAIFQAQAVIDFGDMMILGMAFPNLVGVFMLSGSVKADLDLYMARLRAGEFVRYDDGIAEVGEATGPGSAGGA
jgi:AGCS family alanine or glycine:cation symporter